MGYLEALRCARRLEWKFNALCYGDSTTQGVSCDSQPNPAYPATQRYGYPWKLRELIEAQTGYPCDEFPARVGRGGCNIAGFRAAVDADLNARSGRVDFALVNIGKGDYNTPITQQHVSDTLYIVDSLIVRYPGVKIYLARPWQPRAPMSQWNDLAHCFELVEQQRFPQVLPGIDERVFLENGDNGATYTYSNHPNHAGYMRIAEEWLRVLLT